MSLWWINNSGVNTLKGEPAYIAQDGRTFRTQFQAEEYMMITGLPFTEWTDSNGNPPDPDNPLILDDVFILECIHTVSQARKDFFKILPSLNSKEQERLNDLIAGSPFALEFRKSTQEQSDALQDSFNKTNVRTVGPRGGTRIGG